MEDCIAKIKQARALLAAARTICDTPQIDAMLRTADTELHWALWNLGEPVSLHPELERSRTRG